MEEIIIILKSFEFWDSTEDGYNSTLWILKKDIGKVANEIRNNIPELRHIFIEIILCGYIEASWGIHRTDFEDIANDILINLK